MTDHNILDFKGIQLKVGDKLRLTQPQDDDGFFSSNLGEKFKEGVMDELTAEAIQREWLEVNFILTAKKDGKPVTDRAYYGDPKEPDTEWSEQSVGYHFIRYIIEKGAVKL